MVVSPGEKSGSMMIIDAAELKCALEHLDGDKAGNYFLNS
jgi:hypothetical protein